jgi:hypothetical protein
MYVFGIRVTVKKWKHRPPIRKDTAQNPNAQHAAGDEDKVIMQLMHTPWTETSAQMHTQLITTPSLTTSIFGQHNIHKRFSPFDFGLAQATPHHQSIFGRSSPVTPVPEPD